MRKALIIASEVRSGSTFIGESIAYHFAEVTSSGFFDLTKEHFGHLNSNSSSAEILAKFQSLYTNQVGWVATKIMCAALSLIVREGRKDEVLKQEFFGPNTYWIIVRRRRKVFQAVSLAYARKTGVWHSYTADPGIGSEPSVQFPETEEALRTVVLSDIFLETFSHLIADNRKIEVYYEDFLQRPELLIDRLYEVLQVREPAEGVQYVNRTKLLPTSVEAKRLSVAQFDHWFLENYYAVDSVSLADPPASSGSREARIEATRFKRNIVDAVLNQGKSIPTVAREYGIERKLIRYWIEKHNYGELDESIDGGEDEQVLKRRISLLEDEVNELRRLRGNPSAPGGEG